MDNKQSHKGVLKEWIKKKLPPRCARLLKRILIRFLSITKKDLDYFYNEDFATSPIHNKAWAEDFCGAILKAFNPKSVIDFGCATGDLLYPFEKKGIEILGIDGSRANYNHRKINKDNFLLFDIRNTYKSKKKYDLCFCLEVAEHIKERYSNILINNLTQSSSKIIFSAEPTGQEAVNHINLKSYGWWIKKFEEINFKFDESLTEYLKQEITKIPGIPTWYIKNLLIFRLAD